jgi:hypothetical protein
VRRRKLVLVTETLRALAPQAMTAVVGAGQKTVETQKLTVGQVGQISRCASRDMPACNANTESPAACMKTWGMTCPDVIR